MKKKNYFIYVFICLVTIVLTLVVSKAIRNYNRERYTISPLENVVEEISINEVGIVTKEMNKVVLYIGYTNDSKTYASEERILKYIDKHDLKDKFIYINVDKYLKGDQYIEILKNTFGNITIKQAPMLIYIKDGELIEIVSNTNGNIYTSDLENLNEKYDLEG